jgi:hypothetical protein
MTVGVEPQTTTMGSNIIVVQPLVFPVRGFNGSGPASEIEEFLYEVRASWRTRRLLGGEEKNWFLCAHLGETVMAELQCRDCSRSSDPEATLALLKQIYGEKRNCAQLMRILLQTTQVPREAIRAYSNRVHAPYQALTSWQRELGLSVAEDCYLRDSFIENLQDSWVRRQVEEIVYREPAVTFLTIRDAAIRWAGV